MGGGLSLSHVTYGNFWELSKDQGVVVVISKTRCEAWHPYSHPIFFWPIRPNTLMYFLFQISSTFSNIHISFRVWLEASIYWEPYLDLYLLQACYITRTQFVRYCQVLGKKKQDPKNWVVRRTKELQNSFQSKTLVYY